MKTYTVLYAEDIPHYATIAIEATDDAAAVPAAKARDFPEADDIGWNSPICRRIVCIVDDASGEVVDADIPLDTPPVGEAPADTALAEAAEDLLQALQDALLASGFGITAPIPDAERYRVPAWVWKARAAVARAMGLPAAAPGGRAG